LNGRDRQDGGSPADSLDLVGIIVHWVDRPQDTADMGYIHGGQWYPKIGTGWRNTG
jgi:hypothetical protein